MFRIARSRWRLGIVLIVLSALGAATAFVSVSHHYCNDSLISSRWYGLAKSCGGMEDPGNLGEAWQSVPCCRTEVLVSHADGLEAPVYTVLAWVGSSVPADSAAGMEILFAEPVKQHIESGFSPPWGRRLLARYRILLI